MAKTLFQGETYRFRKEGSNLILAAATDNSDEVKTFREGIVVSGSVPITAESDNDTSEIMNLYNNSGVHVLKVQANGKVRTYGGDFYVHGADDNDDYLRLHVTGDNSYIDFKGDDGTTSPTFLNIRENATTRLLIVGKDSETTSYTYGFYFNNPSWNHSSQTYGIYNRNGGAGADPNYSIYHNNDGNSSNNRGMLMRCGPDNGSTSGTSNSIYFFKLTDGDGTAVSYVTQTAGSVNWGSFTGAHEAVILQSDNPSASILETETWDSGGISTHPKKYPTGTIVRTVKAELPTIGDDVQYQPNHYIVSSSIFQDKQIFGVYCDSFNALKEDRYITNESGSQTLSEKAETPHNHNIWSIGDGVIIVSSQNGNIEVGDYITTASGSGGLGVNKTMIYYITIQ